MKNKYQWGSESDLSAIDPHSIAKHEILEAYLIRYVEILASNHRVERLRLNLVDGFSGGGLYRLPDHSGLHEGSPLIFLRAMKAAHASVNLCRSRPFELDAEFFFVERQKRHLSFLQSTVQERAGDIASRWPIHYKPGTFDANVDSILEHITARGRAHRSIFLLDQYGYADVPVALLRKIFSTLPKAEVILTFAVDSLIDYMTDTPIFRNTITKTGFDGYIDLDQIEILKSQSSDWRFIIQSQLYRALVDGSKARFFTPFFIVSRQSNRAYWLVHLSNHMRARDEMANLHWLKHTYFTHHGTAGLNMLGYDPKRDPEITKQESIEFVFDSAARELTHESLLVDIPKVISRSPDGMTLFELLSATCNNTPATSAIYKNAIATLITYKELEALSEDGGKRRGAKLQDSDILKLPRQMSLLVGKR